MKKFIKENWFKLGILLAVFFIGGLIFYYYIFFIPKQELIKKNRLTECLYMAEIDYKNILSNSQDEISTCKDILKTNPYRNSNPTKAEDVEDNLSCVNVVVTKYSNILKDEKEKCYKLYPQY